MLCRFLIMGGECNYLLRCVWPSCRLEFVPEQVQTRWAMSSVLLLSRLHVVGECDGA